MTQLETVLTILLFSSMAAYLIADYTLVVKLFKLRDELNEKDDLIKEIKPLKDRIFDKDLRIGQLEYEKALIKERHVSIMSRVSVSSERMASDERYKDWMIKEECGKIVEKLLDEKIIEVSKRPSLFFKGECYEYNIELLVVRPKSNQTNIIL
jgi:hypothetical protein